MSESKVGDGWRERLVDGAEEETCLCTMTGVGGDELNDIVFLVFKDFKT